MSSAPGSSIPSRKNTTSSSTPTPNPDAHPDYLEAIHLSSSLRAHVRALDITRLTYRAAVIDKQQIRPGGLDGIDGVEIGKGKGKARTEWAQLDIIGWSKFLQGLERQHASLELVSLNSTIIWDIWKS